MAHVFITTPASADKPTATVIKFPLQRRHAVLVERERNDLGWVAVTHDREFGLLCGSFHSAIYAACELARPLGVAVQSSAGITAP
jgi:hypothetical protein